MKKYTYEELQEIIAKHRLWLRAEAGGERANLSGADLRGAILSGADLRLADLSGAYLSGASLIDASLIDARHDLEIPVVGQLDSKVLASIEAAPAKFDMSSWHTDTREGHDVDFDLGLTAAELVTVGAACGTTHCRAGWAIHHAGEAGYALEKKIGAEAAGALIYQASTGRVPDFRADNETALADIRECAAREQAASVGEP